MAIEERIAFDVACALAVLHPGEQLPLTFPPTLRIEVLAQRILEDCVDLLSFATTSCRIRADFSSSSTYRLHLGNDELTLFGGGDIRIGGSGVTIQLYDRQLNRHYALKVPRASVLAYMAPDFMTLDNEHLTQRISLEFDAFENERRISRRLSHENIARHFYGSSKAIPGVGNPGLRAQFPFSVSEWIEGAHPLHRFLLSHAPSVRSVISIVTDTFSALAHIHAQQVIHWDLKCDNILISSRGTAKIIDFGNAKLFDVPRTDDLLARTTKDKYPKVPVFSALQTGEDESRRFRVSLPDRSWNHPTIDLWMLAQEWNRCLLLSETFLQGTSDLTDDERRAIVARFRDDSAPRSAEARDCLRIVFDRVLFALSPSYVSRFIGPGDTFVHQTLYYHTADEILAELSRIRPSFGAAQEVPELLVSLDEIVRLPVTGNSVFTGRVAALVDTKVIQPATLHNQLAQVRQVFPGATHTRFEHLLGTLTTAAYYLRSLYLNDMNAFWRVSADAADIRSVLLASILHDAGHLAFGHFIEEMDDLMLGLKHTDFTVFLMKAALTKVLSDTGSPVPAPPSTQPAAFTVTTEALSELISVLHIHWCEPADNSPIDSLDQVAVLLRRVLSIFEPSQALPELPAYLSRSGTRRALDGILKSIVDGPIDADKLDYLRRDSLHCGVFFSNGIDLDRFFESLRACVSTSAAVHVIPSIGVSEKGVAPVETLITARYHLYSTVYWHRTVRCITAILQRLLSEVRLAVADDKWAVFLGEFVTEFRQLEDRHALEWLRSELTQLGLLNRTLAPDGGGDAHLIERMSIRDLVEALLGDRKKYFKVAFELGYSGPVDPSSKIGKTAREQLHDEICSTVYSAEGVGASDDRAAIIAFGKSNRERLQSFRRELEIRFNAGVSTYARDYLHRDVSFRLDTILLDVPEPGKDQIRGVLVDRRNKRTRRGSSENDLREDVSPEFVELASVSPIAATLANVFMRWARRVRIFMTPQDLTRLRTIGLELGDVAVVWESVLNAYYQIDPRQLSLRLDRSEKG